MKKIFLILLFINLSFLSSQTVEPVQHKFNFLGNSNYLLSSDSSYFKQDKFMIGWHWGSGKKISKSLLINQNDGDKHTNPNELVDSCRAFYHTTYGTHAAGPEIMNARGFQYEPTLLLNPSNPDSLVIRTGDTTNPVFGFLNRRGRIIEDISDINFNRLLLDSASLINQIVLSNPWPNDKFTTHGIQYNKDASVFDNYFSGTMYFSINIRRTDTSTVLNDNVLKITLPYTLANGYIDSIRFTNLPGSNMYSLPYFRGYVRDSTLAPDNTRIFYITRQMIPPNNQDITLSAFFTCRGKDSTNLKDNPLIKFNEGDAGTIQKLNINVTYLGGTTLLIDWVRIETPNCQELLRGKFDKNITDSLQKDLDVASDTAFTNKGIKLFRLNTIVEGVMSNWIGEHYVNKLVGNIATGETGAVYSNHYEHYVNPSDRWLGIFSHKNFVSAPFIKNDALQLDSMNVVKNLGLINGYNGYNSSNQYESNPLKSFYETYFYKKNENIPITYFLDNPTDSSKYNDILNIWDNYWKCSYQTYLDYNIKYMINKRDNSYLFSNKYWWGQSFIHSAESDIKYDSIHTGMFFGHRPKTGEEVRANTWIQLILGAKGLFYDSGATNYDTVKTELYDGAQINSVVRNSIENMSDLEFLKSDSAGTDFLRLSNEIFNFNTRLYNMDSIASRLHRPKGKIYFGRKSLRLELYSNHNFIRSNESKLMNLDLQCAYSKGFRVDYIQHPKYSNSILENYINIKNIRTKEINKSNFEGTSAYNYQDSSFYLLSILKDRTLDTNNKSFVLGVLNRRTSPLILESNTASKLDFYSTAEFNNNVENGGYTNDSVSYNANWWQQKYNQKLGIRNITIPFNFKLQSDTNKYCLLHVKELYDTSSYSVNLRNATNTKLIDTIIGQDSPLAINFQPGEGKFLKVDVLEPQKNIVGELDYSNQNKMVIWKDSASGNTFSYHIAFYKKDTIVKSGRSISLNRVYYARSKTFKGQMDLANIDWYDIKPISNNITDRGTSVIDTFDCAYPSIVVRKDTNNLAKAYIVYQCRDTNVTQQLFKQGRIVETILDVTGTYTSSFVSSKEIATFEFDSSKQYEDYGNPVINASKYGNFYSWSSNKGITVAFKKSNFLYLDTSKFDKIGINQVKPNGSNCTYLDLSHPALNPYSIILNSNSNLNENEASLVFQGTTCSINNSRYIYYTRIKLDTTNDRVEHFLIPCYISYVVYPHTTAFNWLNNNQIVQFIWGARQGAFPTVYRALYRKDMDYDRMVTNKYEVVAWERRYYNLNSQVFALNIQNYYPSANALNIDCWGVSSYARVSPIPGNNMDVGKPTLGNPTEIDRTDYFNPKVRGEAVLNFTWGDKIYHTPLDKNSLITDTSNSINGFTNETLAASKIKYVAKGMLPHLMNSPYEIAFPDIWQNRRIYNTLDSVHHITSSARYYYFKKNEVGDEVSACYGFANDSTFLIMTKAKLNGNDLNIKLPYAMVDSVFSVINSDTLYSSWFNVGSSAQLSFVYKGSDMTKNACYIQRADTNLKYYLTLTQTNDTIYNLVNYNMINGNNHDYRLVIQRLDSNSRYNEEVLLGDLHYNDTLFFKSNNRFDSKTIDLATYKETFSKIYPNPSDGKINILLAVDYDRDNKITLLISDITGQVIKEISTDYKDQIKLDMSNASNGSYILQIKGYKHDKPTIGTLQFKINK